MYFTDFRHRNVFNLIIKLIAGLTEAILDFGLNENLKSKIFGLKPLVSRRRKTKIFQYLSLLFIRRG